MSERVPEGWETKILSDFSTFRRGTTYMSSELSEDKERFPLYINMKSFKVGGGYSENGDKFYSSSYSPNQLVQDNDLLIANTDVTESCDILGAPVYLPRKKLKNDVLFSHHVSAINISDDVSINFLHFLLCSENIRLEMKRYGRGTTVKMLDVREIGKLSLDLPPLPEQKKIASILTSVDEVIEKTQLQIDKLQNLKKATMNELLTRGIGHTEFKDSELGRIPEGWETKILSDFSTFRRGTTYMSSELSEDKERFPLYINMKSFKVGGGYSENGDKFYSSSYSPNQLVQDNDLLIANTDVTESCDILGAPVYLPRKKLKNDVLFSHHVSAINISDDVSINFLYFLLCSESIRLEMKRYGRGTTVKMLDVREIGKLSLDLPPLPEQKKIASTLTSIDKIIEQTQSKLEQTWALKKSLMQDLLTGKVRVSVN